MAWIAALAGVMIAVGSQAYRLLVGELPVPLAFPLLRGGWQGPVEMPPAGPAALALVTGLVLYLAGMFALVPSTPPSTAKPHD